MSVKSEGGRKISAGILLFKMMESASTHLYPVLDLSFETRQRASAPNDACCWAKTYMSHSTLSSGCLASS